MAETKPRETRTQVLLYRARGQPVTPCVSSPWARPRGVGRMGLVSRCPLRRPVSTHAAGRFRPERRTWERRGLWACGHGLPCDDSDWRIVWGTSIAQWLENLVVEYRDPFEPVRIPVNPCMTDCPDWLSDHMVTELTVRLPEDVRVEVVDDRGFVLARDIAGNEKVLRFRSRPDSREALPPLPPEGSAGGVLVGPKILPPPVLDPPNVELPRPFPGVVNLESPANLAPEGDEVAAYTGRRYYLLVYPTEDTREGDRIALDMSVETFEEEPEAVEDRPTFQRADADGDGRVGVGDALAVLEFLFLDGVPPVCLDAADATDDERIGIGDALAILFHRFVGKAVTPGAAAPTRLGIRWGVRPRRTVGDAAGW